MVKTGLPKGLDYLGRYRHLAALFKSLLPREISVIIHQGKTSGPYQFRFVEATFVVDLELTEERIDSQANIPVLLLDLSKEIQDELTRVQALAP